MKKSKKITIIAITLIVLIISILLGYTYSKYVNAKEVSATASSAKWSFNGAISKDGINKESTISLNDTITSSMSGINKLAPGTKGEFQIILDATGSELDVDYDVFLSKDTDNNFEESKPRNLYFTCSKIEEDGTQPENYKKYYSLQEMLSVDDNGTSNLNGKVKKDSKEVITVNWEWPYETETNEVSKVQADILDTEDNGKTDYNFKLNIVGKQSKN